MPYAAQGVKGFDDDNDDYDYDDIRKHGSVLCKIGQLCKFSELSGCSFFLVRCEDFVHPLTVTHKSKLLCFL